MAAANISELDRRVTVGIDTHSEVHVAAAFTNDLGRPLGHLEIPTTPYGYRKLLRWAQALGTPTHFGIEGTGSYGAGLARFLRNAGYTVIEVNRPNRQTRHRRGKSDPVDAEAAARAVLSGEANGIAKDDQDRVGMIRALRVTRRSAVKTRTQAINQMRALLIRPDRPARAIPATFPRSARGCGRCAAVRTNHNTNRRHQTGSEGSRVALSAPRR